MLKLRDYQKTGSDNAAKVLKERRIVYLSYEVRCGKTLTAFATLQKLGADRCLFVTKKKAIKSIEEDAKLIGFDAVVTNYESLHKVTEKFKYFVIDEAHCCGTFPKPSKRYKQLKAMINQNSYVILLSGTPSPEGYSQLFHQFQLHPFSPFAKYRNFYAWSKDFVTIGKTYVGTGQAVNDYSNARWNQIEPYVRPLMLSYTQKQAGFTQTIIEKVLTVPMRPSTYRMIKAISNDGIYEGREDVILADTGVKMQSKVHQLCGGTVICEGETRQVDNTKVKAIIRKFEGRKIAIFTVYQEEAAMIKAMIPNCTDNPEAFNLDPTATYVGQIRSSREGVNLSSADCLVYYNIEFSALSYLQGRDRATSKDRTTPPEVWFIMAEDGIESKIYNKVKAKEDFTNTHFKQWKQSIKLK
jgi:hypothetical protein